MPRRKLEGVKQTWQPGSGLDFLKNGRRGLDVVCALALRLHDLV